MTRVKTKTLTTFRCATPLPAAIGMPVTPAAAGTPRLNDAGGGGDGDREEKEHSDEAMHWTLLFRRGRCKL